MLAPFYSGTVWANPVTRTLKAEWRISFVRTPHMADSVTFLLNNALSVSHLGGPDVKSYAERSGDPKRVTVRLTSLNPGDSASTIEIAYSGTPAFSGDSINGMSPGWVELGLDSFWHPVIEDFAHSISAVIRVNLGNDWKAVASGEFTQSGEELHLRNSVPLIDIAFAASPFLEEVHGENVSVYYHAGEPPILTAKVLETAGSCARTLNNTYGRRRSLPHVKMVIAPRVGPGYARKNYIVITRTADTATVALTRFICHELAHFWSSGANSTGPENWLNEGFAEYVSARYVRSKLGEDAYNGIVRQWTDRARGQPAIWTPQSQRRPMVGTSYGKAPLLIDRLERRVGKPTMDRLLVRYMTESIASTSSLIEAVREVAGADVAQWLLSALGDASPGT
ncbi:MAG: M1 family aminopeptidase [Gemmatimonadaceae bacterium]